jgi:uncharacterized protein YutE (UPF0331/DUF86 family)
MAYESPLFQSSLELFGHSIEHFNWGTEKDRKFVILHLANAVELIFKDLLLDLGESIYKNPKETITISGSIKTLTEEKGITIPNLNKLELLIDERNSLQHRYGFPNELTTIFYMEATHKFFNDFLKENYDLDIDEVISEFVTPEDLATFQLRKATTSHELDKLSKLSKVHPVGALLSAYAYLEKQLIGIREIINSNISADDKMERNIRFRIMRLTNPDFLPRMFDEYGVELKNEEKRKLSELRHLRNQTAHGRDEPEQKTVSEMIKFIKALEPKISELKEKVEKEPTKLFEKEFEKEK